MAPDSQSIDGLVNQITTTNNLEALAHTLRTPGGSGKDVREFLLASPLSSGQDPLSVLDSRNNTLGVLYILSARLNLLYSTSNSGIQIPPWPAVVQFCESFHPEQARLAPDRMVMLAKVLLRFASDQGHPKLAIPLLTSLATRLPNTLSALTPIHPLLLLTALQTKHTTPQIISLLIDHPIDDVYTFSSTYPDLILTPTDNILYHYLGGIILTKAMHYTTAIDYFEAALTSPVAIGSPPTGLQLEALKKLRLVQCIALGGPQPLPKYTSQVLTRIFKNTPYFNLINAFPGSPSHSKDRGEGSRLKQLIAKDRDLYESECSLGLVERLAKEAPKWIIKRLTETYVTLGLAEIGKYVGIDNQVQTRALVLSMIESKTIVATISDLDIVTFHDAPGNADISPEDMRVLLGALPADAEFQKVTIPALLEIVQMQSNHLSRLDMDIGANKDFISKAIKMGGGSGIMGAAGPGFGPGGSFPDEDDFPSTPGAYGLEREDTIMFT
ncbi:hypothetical protein D9757_004138 [Collybiopsis confluens]|uniref:COP9 signalosome complex subunit 3 N-terminal helical repeats domain-containing protein n=1 Tax=Collybiopsis confluens TaxID=2823264 RepID=A0A8H5HUF8_9AGAR|nr:hypothetical protein D9757_004138 [Collybiopsis confluens]